ncbi:MAG: hypothetical protein IH863_03260, partial [Chloroflexi bacterium]|nr:hypothetical protein [Chloroflexota bacterium]
MRPPIVAVLVACAVVFVACGGDASSSEPSIDFAAEARRLVVDAVFSVEDLPGYEKPGADSLPAQAGLSDECDIFDPAVVFPGAVATADSGAFESALDDQIFNLAGVYRSADDAGASLTGTRGLIVRCEDEFEDAVEQVARDFLDSFGIDLGL